MKNKRGISFWGFIWGAALLICATIVLLRALPPYLNNQKINTALEWLLEERTIMTDSRITLLRKFKRLLGIDFDNRYVDLNKAFQVKQIKNKRQITVNYEVVVHLAYNASLLLDFKNEIMAARNAGE